MTNLVQKSYFLWVWGLVLCLGFWKLMTYSNTPGIPAIPRMKWPIESSFVRKAGIPLFMIFVHPHCPCSAATLGELERLLVYIKGKSEIKVIFFKSDMKNDWMQSSLWQKAQSLPGVEVLADPNGIEARKFGAVTSGQTFLYDSIGNLIFRGGITPSRGHQGDSVGRDMVLSYFKTGIVQTVETPVFGCSLKNPERATH